MFNRPFGTYAIPDSNPALKCRAIINHPYGIEFDVFEIDSRKAGEPTVALTQLAQLVISFDFTCY